MPLSLPAVRHVRIMIQVSGLRHPAVWSSPLATRIDRPAHMRYAEPHPMDWQKPRKYICCPVGNWRSHPMRLFLATGPSGKFTRGI